MADSFNADYHVFKAISSIEYPEAWMVDIEGTGQRLLNYDKLTEITDFAVSLIARLTAHLIDAGSEAEAVQENSDLWVAVFLELKGWSNHPSNLPQED